jgi:chemotaxis protein CheY-P-specific phosphatase CheC
MDLQTRKLTFIQEFLRIQNEDVISALEKMLKKRRAELYEKNLKPMSMEHFNTDIDQSLEDSANDRVINARDLKEEIKKWN